MPPLVEFSSFIKLALGAAVTVADKEQEAIDYWLPLANNLLIVLIFALVGFAIAIRYIAKQTTRPCHWCMEFIPKRDSVCPRCGKNVTPETGTKEPISRVAP